jgi:hypothetical protein
MEVHVSETDGKETQTVLAIRVRRLDGLCEGSRYYLASTVRTGRRNHLAVPMVR